MFQTTTTERRAAGGDRPRSGGSVKMRRACRRHLRALDWPMDERAGFTRRKAQGVQLFIIDERAVSSDAHRCQKEAAKAMAAG